MTTKSSPREPEWTGGRLETGVLRPWGFQSSLTWDQKLIRK